MIVKTEGIVLTHTRYGESSAIIHIYTRDFGMQSYMVNGVYAKKKKSNIVLMQSLNCLDMDVYHRAEKEIQRIKEFKSNYPLCSIPYSQTRRAQAFLITEILTRILRNEGPNESLYNYVAESIMYLDSNSPGLENFHHYFLFNLTRHLGFFPHNNFDDSHLWFDLSDGYFVSMEPAHPNHLTQATSTLFAKLFEATKSDLAALATNVDQRRSLLEALILFYELHYAGIGKIKSVSILEELFR